MKVNFDTFEFEFPTNIYDFDSPKFVCSARGVADCKIEV